MRYKIFLLCLIVLFTCLSSFSQSKYVYYFDVTLNTTEKSKSVFTGFGSIENNLLKLQVLYNLTKQTVMLAHYTDSSLAVSQGLYQSYFINGVKESEGNYENNKEDGLWKKWDSTGHLIDSSVYDHGKKISAATFTYYKTGSFSYHFDDFKNDKMQTVSYNDSGKITREVSFTGQNGIVKHYNKEGIKIDSVFTRDEIEASFPGGDEGWRRYVKKAIEANIDELIQAGESGTCRVRFIVSKDGTVSDVVALTMKGSKLAEVAVNAIRKGPKWKPAMQYGRPVNAYREQSASFAIQNR